jgi:6-phosphogluconate dehydrogenase
MKLALIGMGVMGSNLAQNFAEKGFEIHIFNRSPDKTLQVYEESKAKPYGKNLIPITGELKDLVKKVGKGIYFIMIQAGQPTISIAENLFSLVEKGSVVVDLANSRFQDTMMLEKKASELGINFFGVGVSGGEEGARYGPSIMVGGATAEAYDRYLREALEKVAAVAAGKPCVAYLGNHGAGHFVKMVHNGIEYADMQLIAESYDLMSSSMEAQEIAEVFESWNRGKLDSFLIQITAEVLRQNDPRSKGQLVDNILDRAMMKGTGTWTIESSLGIDGVIAIPSIYAAVASRAVSSQKKERVKLSKLIKLKKSKQPIDTKSLGEALYVAKVSCYAQGFELIKKGYAQFSFGRPDMSEIAKIWRAGCIIRAKFLDEISESYSEDQLSLLVPFERQIYAGFKQLRKVCSFGIETNTPLLTFDSSRNYILLKTAEKLPANLIQGQRDYFGAHTYERTDKKGNYHFNWHSDKKEESR